MTTRGDGNLPEPVVALREHQDALIQIRLAFIEGQLPFGYRVPALALDAHVRENTGRILASSHHQVLVHLGARSEDGLIGYAIGHRKLVPGLAANRIGTIEELYVVPEYRCVGLGRRLQDALVQKMIRLGVDRVELEVLALNETAVRFWLDHGYTTHHHVLVREVSDHQERTLKMSKTKRIKESIECWLLRRNQPKVVLLRVAESPGKHPAFLQPVTGGIKTGESPEDACIREVREETGLELTADDLQRIPGTVDVTIDETLTVRKTLFAAQIDASEIRINSEEHVGWELSDLHDVVTKLYWQSNKDTWSTVSTKLRLGA